MLKNRTNHFNRLYQNEHRIPHWTASQILTIEINMLPISKRIKRGTDKYKNKKSTLPKSELSKAINYTLNEYDALCNYIRPQCRLYARTIMRLKD